MHRPAGKLQRARPNNLRRDARVNERNTPLFGSGSVSACGAGC